MVRTRNIVWRECLHSPTFCKFPEIVSCDLSKRAFSLSFIGGVFARQITSVVYPTLFSSSGGTGGLNGELDSHSSVECVFYCADHRRTDHTSTSGGLHRARSSRELQHLR